MKYLVIILILLAFSLSTTFASGGPSFERLFNQSHNQKHTVALIDKSNKSNEKLRICPKNKGTTVELVPC